MKKNYVNAFCDTIKELHKKYPAQNIGKHLDHALADYPSLFGISDKELSFAMDKYVFTLENDPIASEAEVDKIIRDTERLFSRGTFSLDDEEEEDF